METVIINTHLLGTINIVAGVILGLAFWNEFHFKKRNILGVETNFKTVTGNNIYIYPIICFLGLISDFFVFVFCCVRITGGSNTSEPKSLVIVGISLLFFRLVSLGYLKGYNQK